jgi:hypothetical protein
MTCAPRDSRSNTTATTAQIRYPAADQRTDSKSPLMIFIPSLALARDTPRPSDDRKIQSLHVTREICPRRSGRTWQESMWNRFNWEKQMMRDANRSVRPDAVARKEHSVHGHISVLPSRPGGQPGVERLPASLLGSRSSASGGAFVGLEPYEGRTFRHGSEGGVSGQPLAPGKSIVSVVIQKRPVHDKRFESRGLRKSTGRHAALSASAAKEPRHQ